MRVIKFRAWNKKKNKWQHEEPCNILGEIILLGGWMAGVSILDLNDIVVMQYIGLKDKNGKEIYEGDIIKWDDSSKGRYWRVAVVELNPDIQFRIVTNTLHPESCRKGTVFHFANFVYTNTHEALEIVGNIYENPEIVTYRHGGFRDSGFLESVI
jgi:uncharacterized phage protein (TIGR01671 family)